jgi:signal transduction histidine kinase
VRTHLYQQLARRWAPAATADTLHVVSTASALDDIDIQIRQSADPREQELWESVRAKMAALAADAAPALLHETEQDLRELRNFYDLSEYRSAVETANGTYLAQAAIGLACGTTVLLFLIYLLIVRRWLIYPIQVLKDAAQTIGQGRLDHRVPLNGADELSQLARSIDAMADGLARYQTDLVRSRELSALGELCANVAHGLRNPLAAIRSTAQLAERRAATDEQRQVFRDLSAQADRMDDRITTLFEFSHPGQLTRRPTSFSAIAENARAQALPLLQARSLELRVVDQTGGASFELDCEQLVQAVAELITNAAYHSQPGQEIQLHGECSADNAGGALLIRVRDAGAGMSAATLQKAFDLFFTTRSEGTGIGLALVQRIVERHGGAVTIDSQPRQGTTVALQIPATARSNGHPTAQPSKAVDGPEFTVSADK